MINLTDEQINLRDMIRKFGAEVMRPAGIELDKLHDPADVIAGGSVLWDVFKQYRQLGLHKRGIPKTMGGMLEDIDPISQIIIGEEMGFVGALLLLALIGIVLWRILRAASLARDSSGRLIACGVAALIFFQSMVNIGMNLGLLPVIGIPLPFISSGGSSLIALLLAEGLVQSVVMRHRKIGF